MSGSAISAVVTAEALAHLDNTGRAHLLIEHLRAVAELAAGFASHFGAGDYAYAAGLWHDFGKYGPEFQNRIRTANGFTAHMEGEPGGDRDHSTAGAIHAQDKLGKAGTLIAFAIAGHHAGLANRDDLKQRLLQKRSLYELALRHGATAVADAPSPTWTAPKLGGEEGRRHLELWTRLVFSALCDADFLDTEAFFDAGKGSLRGGGPTLDELEKRLAIYMETKEADALSSGTEVNRVRAEVRIACHQAATRSPGVFSLTVPTGGGKTLAGLSFALRHACLHGRRRIIVAIPYTSIIEQTAQVYRDALGEESVIEHHSALDPARATPRNRVASENWDAPLVVTTTVQLLESLLANRPGACRKLHNIIGSVIILDEAQTLPPGQLAPIIDILTELVRSFGVTLVFSTATQPAFCRLALPQAGGPLGFEHIEEIVPSALQAFPRLRRVRAVWPQSPTRLASYEPLADELANERDALAIVHRREDARQLCLLLDRRLSDASTLHLSALMCPVHRSQLLAEIKARKASGQAVRLVATQLVEAGVDLDFPVVYRALGGLDSMAQAAGRCNREGRLPSLGELRIFIAPTEPPRGVPQAALAVTREFLQSGQTPELDRPETFALYFQRLYAVRTLDEKEIQAARADLRFRDTAEKFKIVEDDWSAPLIIPYDAQANSLLASVSHSGPTRELLRSLQRYTINVPAKDRESWIVSGAAEWIAETIVALRLSHRAAYDQRFGLIPSRVGVCSPETLIA